MSLSAADVRVGVLGSALGAHPGAEIVGQVIEAGEAAQHLLGGLVAAPRVLPCGECAACQRGYVGACSGRRRRGPPGPEEVLPARFLLPLGPPLLPAAPPPGEVWRLAALSDALLAPYAGLSSAGQCPGGLVVVVGGGSRAAAALLVLSALGCRGVVISPDPASRQELCRPPFDALGAIDSNAFSPEGALEFVLPLCAQHGIPRHGIQVLETTGSAAGRARALGMARAGAQVVLLDPPKDALAGDAALSMRALDPFCEEGCRVIGAGAPHPDLLPELLALCVRARIDLVPLTRAIAPHEIEEELARRRRGQGEGVRLPIVRYA